MHPNPVLIVSWLDADEHYHARLYMSIGTRHGAASSLRLLAHSCEDVAKEAAKERGLPAPDIEWLWLGLIADDSREHLATAIVEEQNKRRAA